MISSRIVSMVMGLAGIPILLNSLKTENFAAWAVLLGGSVAFYSLEMGMTPTVVKFLSSNGPCDMREEDVSRVLSNAIVLLAMIYLLFFVGLFLVAEPLTAWLNLPDTPTLSAAGLLFFVFVMVSAASLLRVGENTLHAVRRFDMVAMISVGHALVSNICAWSMAIVTHRLDLVIYSYWVCQVVVFALVLLTARRVVPWRFDLALVSSKSLRPMLSHGIFIQFSDFSNFLQFQFDKMIIAGFSGLSEVAHYEIGNRSALAMRSMCTSGLGTFLPTAAGCYAKGEDIWPIFLDMTRIALLLIVFFLLVPIIISPLFLFAWVGQIGFHGRFVFMLLAMGVSVSVLAQPVSIFVQAMGRTVLEAKVAICTIIINVSLSLILIRFWGKEGAAAGTGLAMILIGLGYMFIFHRSFNKSFITTLRYLGRSFWPVCVVLPIWFVLEWVIEPMVISSRWYMAPAAVLLYGSCVMALFIVLHTGNRLGEAERELLSRIPGLWRFFIYLGRPWQR